MINNLPWKISYKFCHYGMAQSGDIVGAKNVMQQARDVLMEMRY